MPDAPQTPAPTGAHDSFGFLTRKLGPAPVWLWALLAIGGYYAYTKYKGGSASSASSTAAVDPATGQTYAQELSDAEDSITTLQAQVNGMTQGSGPTTVNVNTDDDETSPGSGTPKPKPPETGASEEDYWQQAIEALKKKGIKDPTSQQIQDERNDIRASVGLKPYDPKYKGTDKGVTPTTKGKARAKPKRKAPVKPHPGPIRIKKPPPKVTSVKAAA